MFIGQGITPFKSQSGAVSGFSIENSFLLDGAGEYFTIPNASLSGTLSGSNKQWSIDTLVKRGAIGSIDAIFCGWNTSQLSLRIRFLASSTIQISTIDTITKTAVTTETYTDTSGWYYITISYDYSQSLGSRMKVFVNGVAATMASDATTTNIDTTTTAYEIGSQNTGSNSFQGNQSLFDVRDEPTTLAQHITRYNGGKPTIGGIYQFNPDNSGSTAQFTVVNQGITATSVNLEDADKTTTTPY
jgi:hypothetical protein